VFTARYGMSLNQADTVSSLKGQSPRLPGASDLCTPDNTVRILENWITTALVMIHTSHSRVILVQCPALQKHCDRRQHLAKYYTSSSREEDDHGRTQTKKHLPTWPNGKHINYLGLVSIIVKAKWIAIKCLVVGFRWTGKQLAQSYAISCSRVRNQIFSNA
jgi:hypothetical protein